jgi:type IV pilus assembly protein PilW
MGPKSRLLFPAQEVLKSDIYKKGKKMKHVMTGNNGFTLIELMITMVISSIIMAGIYAIYNAQTTARRNQKAVVDMMQNLRAGIYFMEREIRVAGFDPMQTANAGITIAGASDIQFTLDNDEDGNINTSAGANERIRYTLVGNTLQRQNGNGAFDTLANNIDALQFYYFNGAGAQTANLSAITTVQIAMVARGQSGETGYTNTRGYSVTLINGTTAQVLAPVGDNIRREMLTTAVRCRNL